VFVTMTIFRNLVNFLQYWGSTVCILCNTFQILQYSVQVMVNVQNLCLQILYLLLMSHELHPYLVTLFKFIHHQLVCSSFQVILEWLK
jgi:hypothetical protein